MEEMESKCAERGVSGFGGCNPRIHGYTCVYAHHIFSERYMYMVNVYVLYAAEMLGRTWFQNKLFVLFDSGKAVVRSNSLADKQKNLTQEDEHRSMYCYLR